jgi:hypothetical protein
MIKIGHRARALSAAGMTAAAVGVTAALSTPAPSAASPAVAATAAPALPVGPSVVMSGPRLKMVQWPNRVGITPANPTASWSGAYAQRCTASAADFSVINQTASNRTMTLNGAAFVKVVPGAVNAVCLWGKGVHTFTLGTRGSSYTTTLTVR